MSKPSTEKITLGKKRWAILFILACTLNVSSIVYLPTMYYLPFLETFGLTNVQQGSLLSVYGTLSFVGYFFGGLFADNMDIKPLLVWSSILTGALAIYSSTTPSYGIMMGIYVCYAFTAIFLQWPAFMKAVRMLGSNKEQPKLQSYWGTFNQIFGIITSYGIMWIFADAINSGAGFEYVIITYGVISIVVGSLIQVFYNPQEFMSDEIKAEIGAKKKGGIDFTIIGQVLKTPATWYCSIFIMGGYIIRTASSYFSPMLNSVYMLPVSYTVAMGIAIKYLFNIPCGPISAAILEKVGYSHKPRMFTMPLTILATIGLILIPQNPKYGIVALMVLSIFCFIRGFTCIGQMLVLSETKVPMAIYGTVAGITSAIGYSSDIWLFTFIGGLMDKYGNTSYIYLMYIIILVVVILIINNVLYSKYVKKLVASDPEKYSLNS